MEQQKLELIDIYDIMYEPWWLTPWAKVACALGLFLLGVGVGYLIYKKTRTVPTVLYWQQALNGIDALEKAEFSDGQAFYLRLTEIMKQYLQERYALQLVDKTDSELLETLKTSSVIPEHVYDTMKDLFDGVMFIKFANQQAVRERMEDAIKKTRELITALQKVA